jgi:HSP20 family protein
MRVSVLRFDPFRDFERLTEQVFGGGGRGTPRSFPMDAYRRGEDFHVELDLPGVDPDSIELTVEQSVLTIRAERRYESQEGDQIVVSERPQGVFSRQLFLADSLDRDKLRAEYVNGVLRLTIPVAERAKPRRIEISGGGERRTIEGHATRPGGESGGGNGADSVGGGSEEGQGVD